MTQTVSSIRMGRVLRSVFLGGVSTLALGALAAPVFAQDTTTTAAPAADTVVVVTGIRGSLQKSMNIKKNAVGVVDAISAQDIGKFPDSNLAAAIQRIPGISVSRGVSSMGGTGSTTSTGDATEVTVRGFGPSFNSTLYDGREAATGASSRAFDFSSVGSDFVSEVDVLKTPDSSLSSGAIGATINIQFAKPFDHDGLHVAGSVSGTEASHTGASPNASLLISDTFANDTFGILADFDTSDKKTRQNHVNIQGWEGAEFAPSQMAGAAPGASTTANTNGWFIQDYGVYQEHTEDKRVDGRLALQWRPSEDLLVTLNDDYSEDKLTQDQYGYSVWFNAGSLHNITQAADGTLTSFVQDNTPTDFQGQFNGSVIQDNEIGLNVKWNVNDKLKAEFDADESDSKLNPTGQLTSLDVDVGYGPGTPGGMDGTNVGIAGVGSGGLPYPTGIGPNGNASMFINNGLIGSHVVPVSSQRNEDKIDQFKAMGTWTEDNVRLRFGLHYLEDTKNLSNYDDFGNNDWQAFSGYGPASGNTSGQALDQSWFTNSFSTAGFINGFSNNGNLPAQILQFNPLTVYNYLNSLGASKANAGCCNPAYSGTIQIALEPGSVQQIKEATLAAFVSADIDAKIADMPLKINVGVRDEETNMTSDGVGQTPVSLQVQAADHTAYQVTFSPTQPLSSKNKYRYLLPNLDMNLLVSDDFKVRFDASRTLTRAPLNDLTPDVNFSGSPRVGALGGTGGNPGLLPYLSDNIDLGAEWYYSKNSYFSADVFVKDVTNFIVAGTTNVTLNAPIKDASGVQTAATSTWTVTSNINGPSAEVRGLELALQHVFGDTGFGFQANATFVDTDKPYDKNNLSVSGFAVTGLANSANLVGFYDKNGFQARLAVNWRGEYLDHFGQLQNGAAIFGTEPTFVNANTQVDFSTSYDINHQLTVYFEGLNLNNSTYSTHGRYKEQVLDAVDFGQRFTVGLHFKY